jgi:hypothetical protein
VGSASDHSIWAGSRRPTSPCGHSGATVKGARHRTSSPGKGNPRGIAPSAKGTGSASSRFRSRNPSASQYSMAGLRYRRSRSSGGNSPRLASHSRASCVCFELLHVLHAQTRFSPESGPPRLRGTKWSALRWSRAPQYQHACGRVIVSRSSSPNDPRSMVPDRRPLKRRVRIM